MKRILFIAIYFVLALSIVSCNDSKKKVHQEIRTLQSSLPLECGNGIVISSAAENNGCLDIAYTCDREIFTIPIDTMVSEKNLASRPLKTR